MANFEGYWSLFKHDLYHWGFWVAFTNYLKQVTPIIRNRYVEIVEVEE